MLPFADFVQVVPMEEFQALQQKLDCLMTENELLKLNLLDTY